VRLRNRLIPTLVSALALALITPALALVGPAPALPEAVAATDNYKVAPGLIFNDPTGSLAKHRRIIDRVEDVIDHAPKGSRIRMAQYLFNLDSTADALIRAYARGVNVQLIIDDYPLSQQTQRLRKVLGTNKKKPSYVARCANSCMSSSKSVMHAKFLLFSQSGLSKTISMVSSANPYKGNSSVSWNNMHTIVGDTKIYNSLDRYFTDMLPDINRPNYYRTTTSGKHKLYFFPRQAVKGTADVPLLDVLNNVRCTGMSAGYGSGGRTVVRIEQWGWSAGRLDIARRAWQLHDQGCKVSVIFNGFNAGPKVLQVLLRRSSRTGQMAVYNAAIDTNGNGRRDKYMHHKVLMVNGRWFGQSKKVVYTGSANFTSTALLANNEIMMRVLDNRTYDAYNSNFNYIRNNWTKRITKAPPIPVTSSAKAAATRVESALESRLATAPDTVNPAEVPVDPAQERSELAPTEPPAVPSPGTREPAPVEPNGGR
jgi:phosphatidylserine/phosphatidylglycerophosphate/cardiolipin synthase-like enzyme